MEVGVYLAESVFGTLEHENTVQCRHDVTETESVLR